jgi:hypothetical protein
MKGVTISAKVVSLDAVRQRRALIALAHADAHWRQVRASFALSGIELTDDDAERAGRVIAGVITYEEAREEISARFRREE